MKSERLNEMAIPSKQGLKQHSFSLRAAFVVPRCIWSTLHVQPEPVMKINLQRFDVLLPAETAARDHIHLAESN